MTHAAVNAERLVLADLVPGSVVRDAALVLGGAALTGLAAQATLYTPLTPVPFTLQTAAMLAVAAVLGTRRGALAMVLYVAMGVAGVPWFSGQAAGWGGASFGYVLSFIVAAGVVGALAERRADRRVAPAVGAMIAGTLIVYTLGSAWLALYLNLTVMDALQLGVMPFVVGDALKIAVVSLALPTAWSAVKRRR